MLKKYLYVKAFLIVSLYYLGLNIYRTRSLVTSERIGRPVVWRFGTRPRTVTACTPQHG